MGWVVHDQPGSLKIDHNGDISNFHSNMLLLPKKKIGIVILMNVAGFNNAAAINIPFEGVAAILQGQGLSPAVDPPVDRLAPALVLLPLLIAVLWLAASLVFIQRWQRRGELPVRGWAVLWRHILPLAVDLGLGGAGWIVLSPQVQAPMATIRLFAPDVFVINVLVTLLSLACALGRSWFVFRSLCRASAVRYDCSCSSSQVRTAA